jgi:antirestriction protein
MPEQELGSPIEISQPSGETHPLAQASVLEDVKQTMGPKQEIVPLVDYLRDIAGKPRGSATGGKADLNSHGEEFIVKDAQGIHVASLSELSNLLTSQGLDVEVLGVQSIGNANQKVTAVVQGVDRSKPQSGFERPTVAEGPHMILAPFAVDKAGQLHLFRTIQMRTGEAVIDTPRGFADAKSLENGEQMYDVENSGEKVTANMRRIVGEESGDALQIRRIVYLGAPRVNGSFVTSKSAIFGVEVDYDAFIQAQKVVSPEELQRRKEQFEHEGLIGDVLDITLPEYANYKRDAKISKDMAADFGTDTVVIDFLERGLTDLAQKERRQREILSAEGQANREFKQEDPTGYVEQRLRASKARHPEKYDENQRKAEKYLSRLYQDALRKAS